MEHTQITRYPAYKDSGVEWLGEIPAHWTLIRGNYVFKTVNERSKFGEEELLSVSEHHGVRPRAVSNVNMFMAESYKGYKLCFPGDLVINSLWAWSRGLGISDYDGIVSTAYSVFRPDYTKYNKSYLNYLLRTEKYVAQYLIASKGIWISRLQLSDWGFLRIPILTPSVEEQTRIAEFLDRKTALIDRAIAQKERLIALLRERRQILIHTAVTRGLNPDAPLKDSGVAWIGEIPAHWLVCSNRRYLHGIKQGDSPAITNDVKDSDCYVLKLSAIKNGDYIDSENKLIPKKFFKREYLVKRGDFLMTRGNTPDLVADICYVKDEPSERTMLSDLIYRLDYNKEVIDPRYMVIFFLSKIARRQIKLSARGSSPTMVKVSQEHIKSWLVILPPLEEQKKIVSWYQRITDMDNRVQKSYLSQIEKLQEYKATLINSAVTGKIRV